MKGAAEEAIDPVWFLVTGLIVLTVFILFYLYFHPSIQGGWIKGLIDLIKKLAI